MRDQVRDSKFYTPVHFSDESVHRFLVQLVLGTREVREVRHMIDYGSETALFEFLSKALHFVRVQIAELPAPRIPGEYLESITLLRNGCVYCIVEGFCDGDVDSDSNRKVSLGLRAILV